MPMPYSHHVLAQRIAEAGGLIIQDPAEYALGAFMPDIRYFTKEPRETYHFPVNTLDAYRASTEVSPDFLLGYEVHLLIDEVWERPELKDAYRQGFPPLVRGRMTRGLQALALEMHCLKEPVAPVVLRPVENALTQALGIPATTIAQAVASMQRYLDQHNLEAAYRMAEDAKLFPAERLATVRRVVEAMKNPGLRFLAEAVIGRASRPMMPKVSSAVLGRLEAKPLQVPA